MRCRSARSGAPTRPGATARSSLPARGSPSPGGRPARTPTSTAASRICATAPIAEVAEAAEAVAAGLGARIAAAGGAALLVDYGAWDGFGDTLQALRGHRPVDPLDAPGAADLTAHVRFRAIAEAARPAKAWGTTGQGAFLERLGITARARALARGRGAGRGRRRSPPPIGA